MRSQKVNSEDVDQKLFETFSTLGYDGTSMEILAKATGLKKASLYHRFPNGKKEMAQHVLNIVEQWIEESVIKTAASAALKPEERLEKIISAIDQLYNGGANNCLLRTLSIGTDAELFKNAVSNCFDQVAKGFTVVAVDMGIKPDIAKNKAKDVNLLIQGSLVMAGATGDKSYFKNTLARIPSLLTN